MARSYSGLALGRLLQIITLIVPHGPGKLTAEGVAASIGCSTRQFSRYKKAIIADGIEVESDRQVGYKIDRDQVPLDVEPTLNEALGLLLCREASAEGDDDSPSLTLR